MNFASPAQGESCRPAGLSLGLSVEGLGRDYDGIPILDGLSFCLPAGETLSVIGPSGCGKSTLLYLLAGLARPDRGRIVTGGDETEGSPQAKRKKGRIAFVLQDYGLFPWKTVEENLALPLELGGLPRRVRREAVRDMLAELRLSGLEERYPSRLSGGQRQRVALGRALITEPEILLMDEPFSSVDALTREHLQNTVLSLWQRRKPTCVLVTHSVPEAVFLGKHVMVLGDHPARKLLWLDNPGFGDISFRDSDDYVALTRRVHASLAYFSDELVDSLQA